MPSNQTPAIQGPEAFLNALRDPGRNLKERYKGDPLALAERFGVKLPRKPVLVMLDRGVITEEEAKERFGEITPGLREMVSDVCNLEVRSAVAVGPRGGGKSFGVSFIEFYLWMILDFDALNLGGSELQADQVYRYILGYMEYDEFWLSLVKGDPQRERTYTVEDSWVRVLTASSKSVRSPHAGGMRKGKLRGGVLVIDEEAEAEKDIVESALPTINTARPSVNLRVSTFHNLEGSFQEVVDNHKEMGYKKYSWDIFDVLERCDCVGVCQSEEPCFREDHHEDYIDADTGELKRRLIHKSYCGGRGMYADGWIPLEEAETLWKRMRRNHSRWEVEAMGSRPSTSGFAVKDLNQFAANIVDESAESFYLHGAPVYVTVDWGTGAAGVCVWQSQPGKEVLLHADQIKDNNQTQMNGIILGYAARYRSELVEIAADIGGGGNYMNPSLRTEHRQNVRDVNFNEEKEAAIAAFNIKNEAGEVVIPAEHTEFIHQVRNWKRKNGRIQKGNDHLCDSGIVCHFSRFIDEMGLSNVRIAPRSFHSNPDVRDTPVAVSSGEGGQRSRRARAPVARTFGGKSRRR